MALRGNVATFSWAELIDLFVSNQLEGTLTVHGPRQVVQLYTRGGLVIAPIPTHARLGRDREDDKRRANSLLVDALRWPAARFEFRPGVVPDGLILRRSVALKPSRLLSALKIIRERSGRHPRITNPQPLQGTAQGVGLDCLLAGLTRHKRTGTLLVSSAQGRQTFYFEQGSIYALWRDEGIPGWMVDPRAEQRRVREQVLEACRWQDVSFSFLPDQLPEAFARRPLGLRRVAVNSRAVVGEACREGKLRRARQEAYAACA